MSLQLFQVDKRLNMIKKLFRPISGLFSISRLVKLVQPDMDSFSMQKLNVSLTQKYIDVRPDSRSSGSNNSMKFLCVHTKVKQKSNIERNR